MINNMVLFRSVLCICLVSTGRTATAPIKLLLNEWLLLLAPSPLLLLLLLLLLAAVAAAAAAAAAAAIPQWLNRLLTEVWPYYDRGICCMVKEVVEPIFDQFKPPLFKKIFFQELTFGEAPVRVEGGQSRFVFYNCYGCFSSCRFCCDGLL